MALLVSPDSPRPTVLRPHHRVGRGPDAHTRISDPSVSSEHAAFLWTGEGWELRDLGSRNGTWLQGRRLSAGERVRVNAGYEIAFGDPSSRWTFRSANPPSAVAWSDTEVVEGSGRFLALPSEEDPQAVFEMDRKGTWYRVDDSITEEVESGPVTVAGRTWELELPDSVEPEVPATTRMVGITDDAFGLDFAVSADEEYLEVTARAEGEAHNLPPRAHQYLLLVLARTRLGDVAEGTVPSEAGWVYTSELRKMLRISANQLYVMSHRCRRELEELGVATSIDLIEKRTTSRQVRIGIEDLTVRAL